MNNTAMLISSDGTNRRHSVCLIDLGPYDYLSTILAKSQIKTDYSITKN